MFFLKKNVADVISLPMIDSSTPSTFKSGLTVTCVGYYKDGAGAWTSANPAAGVAEIGTLGIYSLALTAGDLNHDLVTLKFTAAGAADQVYMIQTTAVSVDDLVRSTTPANTLDVASTGEAGLDFSNIKDSSANTATLMLKQISVVNTAGDAVVATSSGSNGSGINASGNGTGSGIKSTGGATGPGATLTGQTGLTATSNVATYAGISAAGNTTGAGILSTAGATGVGLSIVGGATSGDGVSVSATTGNGITIQGNGTASHGIYSYTSATNGSGMTLAGSGTGQGLNCSGGATGNGIYALGGATSGAGLYAASQTSGNGATFLGVSAGHGISSTGGLTGSGASLAAGATSGNGLSMAGSGASAGFRAIGGATGAGGTYTGGATSGSGLLVTGTNGNADAITCTPNGSGAGLSASISGSITGSLSGSVGSITGDVGGKILGGGAGTITATGAWVLNSAGAALAPAATALSNATWTDAKAALLDVATSSRLAPTVAARTLDVAATGEAGLDFDNIHDATGAHTLTNITVPVTASLGSSVTVSGTVNANLTQISGVNLVGGAAILNLKQLNIVNNSGDAFTAGSSGANGRGMYIYGNGSGYGAMMSGGAGSSLGLYLTGQVGGLYAYATGGTNPGATFVGSGGAAGLSSSISGDITGNLSGSIGSVAGNVSGKILGGGVTAITGTGVRAVDDSGNAIAPASTALTNTMWTDAKAGYLTGSVALDSTVAKSSTALTTATWTDAKAAYLDAAISSRLAPTVAARTIDVAATGEVGLDFDNIHDATGAHTLTNITVPTVTSVGSVSGSVGSVAGAVTLAADQAVNVTKWNAVAVASPDTAGYPVVTVKHGTGTGEIDLAAGDVKLAASQSTTVAGYASNQDPATLLLVSPTHKLATDSSGNVTVAGYASNQDPAHQILLYPANKIAIDTSGYVTAAGVMGDMVGKVLGNGVSTFGGVGVQAVDSSGNALASAQSILDVKGTGFTTGDDLHAIKAAMPSTSGLATTSDVTSSTSTITGAVSTTQGVITGAITTSENAILAAVGTAHGSRTVFITLHTGSGAVISDAAISIYDATGTNLISRGLSDLSGRFIVKPDAAPGVALDDGSYIVKIVKGGVAFAIQTMTVSGDGSFTFTGIDFAPPSPSAPDLCVVWDNVVDASGAAAAGILVKATPVTPKVSGGYQIAGTSMETSTDANGHFELELVRGIDVLFSISINKFSIKRTVPAAASVQASLWED